jgi:hypothetical protein
MIAARQPDIRALAQESDRVTNIAYVRQMKNMKASIPLEWLVGGPFEEYAFICGAILARAHARSGDVAKIANYWGKSEGLDEALADFAEAYGDQTERDHDRLVKAIKAGKVAAAEGVKPRPFFAAVIAGRYTVRPGELRSSFIPVAALVRRGCCAVRPSPAHRARRRARGE